ncbi:tetratricopeptide repeat protein [Sandaracinus amylolyticus]|uniref:tetratricopeptide repeat protein n=1 Tax=Sandaracinus amylolyticus TaxID=927083 RepID=UPI001F3868B5|nr:tetratricopeptide repeat protein [Sandaracinus amylolyticus]
MIRFARTCSLALLLASSFAACGPRGGYPIERTIGGERRLGVFVGPHSYEHFVRGELAREGGDLRAAADHYELARAGAVDDPLVIARLAEVRDQLGEREAAERALDEGERLDPRSEAIFMARGAIAERHGELAEAVDAYARAVDTGEGSEEPVIALSRVLRESGAGERADAVLERYLAEHEGGVGAARARLSLAMARGDAATAGLAALELARRSPQHRDEVSRAAEEALGAGHPILAYRLLALMPEGSVPRALRLRVLIAADARSEIEALLASWTPERPEEMLEVARAWLVLGEPENAAELAETALASGSGADARVVLARARLAQGRLGDAATIAAAVPAGASVYEEARAIVADAITQGGLPALADELRAGAQD